MSRAPGDTMHRKAFSLVTGVAGVYHILLALAGALCPASTIQEVVSFAFGVTLDVGPQLALVAKFVSAYMLAFGVMLLLLALDPKKYRGFAIPALALFGVRFLNRVLFFGTLGEAGMGTGRNLTGTAIILFFFVAILVLLPKKQEDSGHDNASA